MVVLTQNKYTNDIMLKVKGNNDNDKTSKNCHFEWYYIKNSTVKYKDSEDQQNEIY